MIDLETRLADAVQRLPGPSGDATERARARVLASLDLAAGGAATDATRASPLPVGALDGAPEPAAVTTSRPRRRRLLVACAGIAVAAALAAAVIAAGLHRSTAPSRAPIPATTPPAPPRAADLGGVLAFTRGDTLYTAVDGARPRAIAKLPPVGVAGRKRSIVVSPDGSRIAVIDPGMVRLFDRNGGNASRVPASAGIRTTRVAFSTDGDIVFILDGFELDAVDRSARVIGDAVGDLISVAPDGSGIAINHASREGLVVYPAALLRRCERDTCAAGARHLVPNATGVAGAVIWGPGADEPIAYIDRQGLELVSAAADRPVPVPVGPDRVPVAFTHDGRGLVVQPFAPIGPLEVIPIERADADATRFSVGAPRRLARSPLQRDGAVAGSVLGVTADDAALLVAMRSGDTQRLELVPLDGEPIVPVDLGGPVGAIGWSGPTPAG